MILQLFMEVIIQVLPFLLGFQIPSLPAEVYTFLQTGFDYISAGAGLLANYIPLPYIMALFFIIISVDGAMLIYHFVMWVIRKIPMAGMS